MDRLRVFRALERAAQPLRRAGLGGVVDRTRGRFERGLGERTWEIDGLRLTALVALHADYLEEVGAAGREDYATELFTAAAVPGATVVDVGAHLGWFTLQAARRVGPTGRVVAFEPNPQTRPLLERNVRLNGFGDRVVVVPQALADRAGPLGFYLAPAGDTSSLHRQGAGDVPVEVEVVTGDAALAGFAPPRAIKLDLEGGEVAALRGLGDTVRRARGDLRVFAECNPAALATAGSTPDALWDALVALGLEPRVIDERQRRLRGREALAEVRGYANLLGAPAGG